MCLPALTAVKQLQITDTTSVSISLKWTLPAGYYDGLHISAVPVSSGAIAHNGTVYGENCVLVDAF